MKDVKCKNCGQDWGDHIGNKCRNTASLFLPEGYEFSDKCEKCGKRFDEHERHMFCGTIRQPGEMRNRFKKMQVKILDDELFEI